jgi:hypothetical protein
MQGCPVFLIQVARIMSECSPDGSDRKCGSVLVMQLPNFLRARVLSPNPGLVRF